MDESAVTLDRMRTFVRVAERGTLSAVARELRTGQSTITRQLRELEQALGVSLVSRTTRRLALTDEGSRYYQHCLEILNLVSRANDDVHTRRDAMAGAIRISCSAAIGTLHVAPLVYAFLDRHPEITIDLSMSEERVDLVRDRFDLAVRLGPLTDSSLKVRALGTSERILVASPAYLAAHGRPKTPADLVGHLGVRMAHVAGSETLVLIPMSGSRSGEPITLPFEQRLTLDNGLAARAAFLAHRGLGPAHRWLIADLLANGSLEHVLPGYRVPGVPLHVLIVPERAAITRVKKLTDYLATELARVPGLAR
ncbi:MAG: LysR family transcriptional regulator [Kofleriaceae bacterium]